MSNFKHLSATPLLAAALLLGGTLAIPAHAESQTMKPAGQTAAPAQHFSKQKLEKFARAESHVREIGERYSKQMRSAKDKKMALAIKAEANKKMVKAVEDAGMSVRGYNAIAHAAFNDPALRKRIQAME